MKQLVDNNKNAKLTIIKNMYIKLNIHKYNIKRNINNKTIEKYRKHINANLEQASLNKSISANTILNQFLIKLAQTFETLKQVHKKLPVKTSDHKQIYLFTPIEKLLFCDEHDTTRTINYVSHTRAH